MPKQSQGRTVPRGTLAGVLAVSLAGALLLTGCTSFPSTLQALKDDPATVVLNVGTVYGTLKLVRIGGVTNNVSVAPDGTVTIGAAPR